MKNIKYISASAGSGKTYRLTQELTEAIQSQKVNPEGVILTTFTKAAANEFMEKAKAMLYENKMLDAADRLDGAMIGTIHSVCQSFIKKYWYVLGLSPELNAMPDDDVDFFREQSLVDFASDEEFDFLNNFTEYFEITNSDFWKDDLKRIVELSTNYTIHDFAGSVAYSKKIIEKFCKPCTHIKVPKDMFESLLDEAEKIVTELKPEKQDEIKDKIAYQKNRLKFSRENSLRYAKEVKKIVEQLPRQKTHWKNLPYRYEIITSLENLYATEDVRDKLLQYVDIIFSMALRWQTFYTEFKRQNRLIDFSDMEKYMLELLDDEQVREDIRNTYKYVFVDEFQDCSPIQLKIFNRLSHVAEHSVWVGDTKQAIYGFRGSDTVLTTAISDVIKSSEADGCSTDFLENSWRSLPSIVNVVNETFSKVFSDLPKREVQLKAKRTSETKGNLKFWLLEGNKEKRLEVIANNIAGMVQKGIAPKDIAVLARVNDSLNKLVPLLHEYNIPVFREEVSSENNYEIALVCALLSLLIDERDEFAKAQIAFLTEEDFSLGKIIDTKLETDKVKQEAGNAQDSEKTNVCDSYLAGIPLVKKLMQKKESCLSLPVSALVEKLIIELDLYNVAMCFPDPEESTEVFYAVIESAKKYEEHCRLMKLPSTINGFKNYLTNNGVKISGSDDSVQLFTFHGAKGLEWKNVILLDSENDPLDEKNLMKRNFLGVQVFHNEKPCKENLFPESTISVLPNVYGEGNSNVPDEIAAQIRELSRYTEIKNETADEAKRLMYVAMTRARDNLIFAIAEKPKGSAPLKYFERIGVNPLQNLTATKETDFLNVGVDFEYEANAENIEAYTAKTERRILKIAEEACTVFPPRDVQPSALSGGEVKAKVVFESEKRIPISGVNDMAKAGSCIHDIFCIAEHASNKENAGKIINGYALVSVLPEPASIISAWNDFTSYMERTYGAAVKTSHELSFRHFHGKQIFTGSIDLVWHTKDGVILVDYKTFPGTISQILEKGSPHYVGNYKGQFMCYENALSEHGEKVMAKLVYYPVAGVVVEIEF